MIGLDHYHIMGITAAVIRGGGELVYLLLQPAEGRSGFPKAVSQRQARKSEDEILDDPSLKLIAGAPYPGCGSLGISPPSKRGKDFLSDKPAVTTLDQLAEVAKYPPRQGKMFAIMYSERLEVRARCRLVT